MGYSCSHLAGLRLNCISEACIKNTGSSNTWKRENGDQYFFETGKENYGGSITGSIWKILPNGMAKRSGGFRIEPDGKISRGPKFMKDAPAFLIRIVDTEGYEYLYSKTHDILNIQEEIKNWESQFLPNGINAHVGVKVIETFEVFPDFQMFVPVETVTLG